MTEKEIIEKMVEVRGKIDNMKKIKGKEINIWLNRYDQQLERLQEKYLELREKNG